MQYKLIDHKDVDQKWFEKYPILKMETYLIYRLINGDDFEISIDKAGKIDTHGYSINHDDDNIIMLIAELQKHSIEMGRSYRLFGISNISESYCYDIQCDNQWIDIKNMILILRRFHVNLPIVDNGDGFANAVQKDFDCDVMMRPWHRNYMIDDQMFIIKKGANSSL